jgi:peroxiredoxin
MNMLADPGVLRAGDRIPDFELVDLDGERVAYSDLEGKGIVLNFWATWCAPCRREMPLLDAAWNEYRSKNVVVVGIDFGEPADVVRRFVDSGGFRYPIWLDPDPKDDDAAETTEMLGWFGAAGLPTTVFIRPDGIIDSIHLGEVNRALLLERLPAIVPE